MRSDVEIALLKLLNLKRIKTKIEAGLARPAESRHYAAQKEKAWAKAAAALLAADEAAGRKSLWRR